MWGRGVPKGAPLFFWASPVRARVRVYGTCAVLVSALRAFSPLKAKSLAFNPASRTGLHSPDAVFETAAPPHCSFIGEAERLCLFSPRKQNRSHRIFRCQCLPQLSLAGPSHNEEILSPIFLVPSQLHSRRGPRVADATPPQKEDKKERTRQ